MGTKLYVANLPEAPSVHALRTHFSACGPVSDVQIVPDRNAGRGRGSAFVRMTNASAAERAVTELNGALFAGQLLVVEAAPDDLVDRQAASKRKTEQAGEHSAPVHITLQFREAGNMTYELNCSGVAVVMRVFFQTTAGQWRVVAQPSRTPDAPGTAAEAASRLEAFRSVARSCREGSSGDALQSIDWEAVEDAMLKVRAL